MKYQELDRRQIEWLGIKLIQLPNTLIPRAAMCVLAPYLSYGEQPLL
jgi:hypothetical protein